MRDLIIIGGGPAALAAAVYALGKQLNFHIISEDIDGKVGLPRGESGQHSVAWQVSEEATHLFEHIFNQRQDLVLRTRVIDVNNVNDHFEILTQHRDIRLGRSVIVASGVTPMSLDVPGARQWLGYGLGYSPTTYAHLLNDKKVVVIGATHRALRGATELARTAAQVSIILPDTESISGDLVTHLQRCPNVSVLFGYRVTELIGRTRVERVNVVRGDEQSYISADAVFADLGLLPHSEMVRHLTPVDREGFIVVDERHATNIPGLFATGDVTTRFSEQITVALGDGTRAAISAYDYLLLTQPIQTHLNGSHKRTGVAT